MRRFSIIPALFVMAAALTCAQTAPVSACTSVTKAEVQEAVGAAVSEPTVDKTNKLVCHFLVGATGSDVSILLTAKGPADSAERTVMELNKRKIVASVVPGLGDGAYTASPGYGMQQLGAFKGSRHIVVTVMMMGGPEARPKAIAEKVMRKALPRL